MNSLNGVPGWLMDATLGCLERMLTTLGGIAAVGGTDAALRAGGVSALGVLVMRMICGPVRFSGDPVVGVEGRDADIADIDVVRGFFAAASAMVETGLSAPMGSFFGICRGPGCWRLPLDINGFASPGVAGVALKGDGGTLTAAATLDAKLSTFAGDDRKGLSSFGFTSELVSFTLPFAFSPIFGVSSLGEGSGFALVGVATVDCTFPGIDLVMVGVWEASVLTSAVLLRSDSFVFFLAGVPEREDEKGRSGTAGVIGFGVAACGVGMPGGGRIEALDGVPALLTGAERPGGTVGVERRGWSNK